MRYLSTETEKNWIINYYRTLPYHIICLQLYLVDGFVEGQLMTRWHRKRDSKTVAHTRIANELSKRSNWPADSKLGTSFVDLMRLENPAFVPIDDETECCEVKKMDCNGREDADETDRERLITQMSVGSGDLLVVQDVEFEQNLLADEQNTTGL